MSTDTLLRRIFAGLPFVVLAWLAWLSFFQHPAIDDFAGHFFTDRLGYAGANRFYLGSENGRFSSIPVFLLFTSSRFLLEHYYIGVLFFLVVTYAGVFFFVRYAGKAFYAVARTGAWYHRLTAFSLLVLLSCMPEPSSFFFWLSTDATYLFSFLLFLFYLVKLHQALGNNARVADIAILTPLILLLGGANEVSLFFSFFAFAGVFLYKVIFEKERSRQLYFLLFVHVGTILLVVCLPGNVHRSAGYAPKQFMLFSAIGAFYQSMQIFFSICSNPLFWAATGGLLLCSEDLKESVGKSLAGKKTSILVEILLLFIAVFALCFAVRHFAGIVLPLRARNIVVCIIAPALMLIALANAGPLAVLVNRASQNGRRRRLLLLAGIFLLVFNPFMSALVQSTVDAPVHDQVLNNRVAAIRRAQNAGMHKVVLSSYEVDFQAVMIKKYGAKAAAFFKVEFPAPPRLLFFADEPAYSNLGSLYAEFYGIDTLQMENNQSIRFSLTEKQTQQALIEWKK